jgi:hypothetical protein
MIVKIHPTNTRFHISRKMPHEEQPVRHGCRKPEHRCEGVTQPALATVDGLAAWMQRERDELPEGTALVVDTASAIVCNEARQRFAGGRAPLLSPCRTNG